MIFCALAESRRAWISSLRFGHTQVCCNSRLTRIESRGRVGRHLVVSVGHDSGSEGRMSGAELPSCRQDTAEPTDTLANALLSHHLGSPSYACIPPARRRGLSVRTRNLELLSTHTVIKRFRSGTASSWRVRERGVAVDRVTGNRQKCPALS